MFCSDRASVPLMGLLLPNLGKKAVKVLGEGRRMFSVSVLSVMTVE